VSLLEVPEVVPGLIEPEGSSPTPVFNQVESKFHTELKDAASGTDLLALAR
jgi:hypothetical protein